MKRRGLIYLILFVIVFVIILAGVYGYFYTDFFKGFLKTECDTRECFFASITECKSSSYIKDEQATTIRYDIMGKEDKRCITQVKVIQVKTGGKEVEKLNGKNMLCSTPQGISVYPESNLENCHGILKEEMQSIIINRMHSQILENIGEINSKII